MHIPASLAAIPFDERVVFRYLRLSTQEQRRGQSFDRQAFDVRTIVETFAPVKPEYLFSDLESGRNRERKGYQDMLARLKAGEAHALAIARIDRVARDVGDNAGMWRFFERLGIELFIVQWDRFVDYGSNKDWEAFTGDSVDAERESRKIAERTKAGHRYSRHRVRAGYVCPYGYVRNKEGLYEIDLESNAAGCIEAFFEAGSYRGGAILANERYGLQWTAKGFREWLLNPVLRGHTEYFRAWKDKRSPEIHLNTHPDQRLLTEQQYESILKIAKQNRTASGYIKSQANNYLVPLCKCAVCGYGMTTVSWESSSGHVNRYLCCSGYKNKRPNSECASLPRGRGLHPNAKYEDVDRAIIKALCDKIEAIADSASYPVESIEVIRTPEARKIEDQIVRLQKLAEELGGATFDGEIAKLKQKLNALQSRTEGKNIELEGKLIKLGSNEFYWQSLTDIEKKAIYAVFVDSVLIDCDRVMSITLLV